MVFSSYGLVNQTRNWGRIELPKRSKKAAIDRKALGLVQLLISIFSTFGELHRVHSFATFLDSIDEWNWSLQSFHWTMKHVILIFFQVFIIRRFDWRAPAKYHKKFMPKTVHRWQSFEKILTTIIMIIIGIYIPVVFYHKMIFIHCCLHKASYRPLL